MIFIDDKWPARVFQREVKVGVERAPDRSHRDTWFQPLGAATWRHVTESAPARPLAIPVKTDASAVLLVIDERDNAPLPVSSATLHLPSYRLRYFEPQEGRLQLAYGRRDLEAPRYDLGLLAERVMGAAAREVTLPPPAAAPDSGETSPPAVLAPAAFWVLLGVAVAAIAFVIVRALKGKEPAAPSR